MNYSLLVLKGSEVKALSNALNFINARRSYSDDGEIIFCGSVPFHPHIIIHEHNLTIMHDTPTHTGGDPVPEFSNYSLEYKIKNNKLDMDNKNKEKLKSIFIANNISMDFFDYLIA